MKKTFLILFLVACLPVMAMAGEKSLNFTWKHDGIGLSEFRLYYSTIENFTYSDVAGVIRIPYEGGTGSFTTSETISAPDGEVTIYYFKMTAANSSMESDPSNEVSAVLDFATPSAPFELNVTVVAE